MKTPSRFLNKSQGEALFKEASGVDRFESGLWEHVEQLCFEYFVEIAKLAGEKVKADGRTVIDLADVQPPEGSGMSTPSPEVLMKNLHALAAQDVSQVAKFGKLITSWVEAEKAKT